MDMWFTAFLLVVALLIAVGGTLLLVGYFNTLPASFSFGWRWWLPTLILPVVGPLLFAKAHWSDCSRAAKQLLFGLLLVGLAGAVLYGGGPFFVDRLAVNYKEVQSNQP